VTTPQSNPSTDQTGPPTNPPRPRRPLGYLLRASWNLLQPAERRQIRKAMCQLFFAELVSGVLMILVAQQSGKVTQTLMESRPWAAAFGVFALLSLVRIPLDYFETYWSSSLSERLSRLFQFRIFEFLQTQSLDFFLSRNPGELMRQLSKVAQAVEFLLCDAVLLSVTTAIFLVAYVTYLFALNWQLTLLLLGAISSIPFIIVWWIYPKLQRISFERNELDTAYGGQMFEGVMGVKEIQLNNAQSWITRALLDMTNRLINMNMTVVRWQGFSQQAMALVGTLTLLVILGAGSWLVQAHMLAGGWPQLFVFYMLVPSVFSQLVSLCSTAARYQELSPQINEGFDILETPPRVMDRPGARPMPPLRDKIVFRNVTYTYRRDLPPTLRDLNFEIKAGQRVAFVGRRGCGKTTIFNLLCRFLELDDDQGVIEIDGTDIRNYTLASVRAQFGMVTQRPFFKQASVKDNLLLAKQDATTEEIVRACEQAQVLDVINSKSDGVHSGFEANINAFSGGEQISIAIARCYLRQPSIILLDEPLASLSADVASELLISLKRLSQGRTCIVISHALQAVADVDKILVLGYRDDRRGRLVQQGTHQELKSQPGYYRELYEKQILSVY